MKKLASIWRLLFRTGVVMISVLTVWVVVGSIWFPEWWYVAIWKGEILYSAYLGYGFSFLLNSELTILLCITLAVAVAAVYSYIKRAQLATIIDRFGIVVLIVCMFSIAIDALYLHQPEYVAAEALAESVAATSQAFLHAMTPLPPPQISAPIDFFYLDSARVDEIFSEMEPELIETQRTISSDSRIGGSASVNAGPASLKGDASKKKQESSTYTRGRSSAERECIQMANFVLKSGSGHYFTTLQAFDFQKVWNDAFEAGRKGYQEAEKGFNPGFYEPIEPIGQSLNEADANLETVAAKAKESLANQVPTPEERFKALKQIALMNQEFRSEAKGFVVVDGVFHIQRSNGEINFQEEFSPPPNKIVFRFTLSSKFDSPVFRDGAKMRVFGDVVQQDNQPAVLTINPIAIFNE